MTSKAKKGRLIGGCHQQRDGKLFHVIGGLKRIEATADIPKFLGRLVEAYDLTTAAYLGVGLSQRRDGNPLVAATYSSDWVSHYRARQYQRIDPAIQLGLGRLLPIDWGDFDMRGRDVKTLFGEASEFGLGRHGLSVPVHAQAGARALFSITSDVSKNEWSRLNRFHVHDFQVFAMHLHAHVLRLEGQDLQEGLLSHRERECLQWVAEGKTVWECAVILGLAGSTVRCYLESARKKLNATSNTHAVSKALTAGLLASRL